MSRTIDMELGIRQLFTYFGPDIPCQKMNSDCRMVSGQVSNVDKVFATFKRTILFLFDFGVVLFHGVSMGQNGNSLSALDMSFGQMVKEVVGGDDEIASNY